MGFKLKLRQGLTDALKILELCHMVPERCNCRAGMLSQRHTTRRVASLSSK